MHQTLDSLRSNNIFEGLDESELELIAGEARQREFRAGEVVSQAGASEASLLLIVSGQVSVLRMVLEEDVPLATLGPGQACGEMSILTNRPRSAAIIADQKSIVLELSRIALDRTLAERPALAAKLWHNLAVVLAERLNATTDLLTGVVKDHRHLLEEAEVRRRCSQL